ncbi:uncharacterized protein LOC122398666 [Colletes gigas]|uniref:uncharacterized protein LOC122398666 n=1 Tax=Colletes gigas TaxID=935657 RepID=UPI001C9AA2D0|nr:uncharacterized protein LOC122398666 [Colletes gigas]
MSAQSPMSDEEYRDRGVPFSCCNLRAMVPCEHTEILNEDVRTINTNGCAEVVSPVLLRIVIVAYVMTSTLVIIQVFLAFLITKIMRKLLCGTCRLYHLPAAFVDESTSVSLEGTSSETKRRDLSTSPSNWEARPSRETKRRDKRRRKKMKLVSSSRRVRSKNKSSAKDDTNSTSTTANSSPATKYTDRSAILEIAKIRPTTHEEHTIAKKRDSTL